MSQACFLETDTYGTGETCKNIVLIITKIVNKSMAVLNQVAHHYQ